jgi:hypothetical protein
MEATCSSDTSPDTQQTTKRYIPEDRNLGTYHSYVHCTDFFRTNSVLLILYLGNINWPVTVAAQSKALNVFARSNTGIVGSNPARGMNVCVYSVFVLSCVGSGLTTGWSLVQGVLPTVYKCKIKEAHKRRPRPDMGCKRHWMDGWMNINSQPNKNMMLFSSRVRVLNWWGEGLTNWILQNLDFILLLTIVNTYTSQTT